MDEEADEEDNNTLKVSKVENLPSTDQDLVTFVVMLKGAPEVILSRCNKTSINNELKEITDDFRSDCMVLF